jgi:hypothetical protein
MCSFSFFVLIWSAGVVCLVLQKRAHGRDGFCCNIYTYKKRKKNIILFKLSVVFILFPLILIKKSHRDELQKWFLLFLFSCRWFSFHAWLYMYIYT